MKRTILAVILVLLLNTTMAFAQEATPPAELPKDEPPQTVSVTIGEYVFDIDGEEPVVTCIEKVSADLDGQYFQGYVLVRSLDGRYDSVARIESRATAEFVGKQPGDCVP